MLNGYDSRLLASALKSVPKEITLKSALDGKEVKAHKFVLLAVSAYFLNMYTDCREDSDDTGDTEKTKKQFIHNLGFSGEAITQAVKILYQNSFPTLKAVDYIPILAVLDHIQADDFVHLLSEKIKQMIGKEVAIDVCIAAHAYGALDVKSRAIEVIIENFEWSKKTTTWKVELYKEPELIEEIWEARQSPNVTVITDFNKRRLTTYSARRTLSLK
jgi:hypothetical protein